jgi:hypothetical protein
MSDFAQPVVSNNNIGIGTLNGPSSSTTSQIQDMPGEDNQQQQQQQQQTTTTSCKLTAGTDGTGRTLGPTDGKGTTTTTTTAGGNNNGGGSDGQSSGGGDGVGTEVTSTSTTVVLPPPNNGPLLGTGTVVVTTNGPLLLGSSTTSTLSSNLSPAGGGAVTTTQTKKTSFQITSVTVDSSASNDGGDDSADDLDESHTEDSSTGRSKSCRKVVDVRQGLFVNLYMEFIHIADTSKNASESRLSGATTAPLLPPVDDKFTRNDIFYNPAPPSSINTAPVIPTSSQYGLAIVSEVVGGSNNAGGGNGGGGPGDQLMTSTSATSVSITNPADPSASSHISSDKGEAEREIVHNRQ